MDPPASAPPPPTWRDEAAAADEVPQRLGRPVDYTVSENDDDEEGEEVVLLGREEDEIMDEDEEDEGGGHEDAVAIAVEAALDVGALIEAMQKCVAFYHRANKMEFYAMVAEEYNALLPDRSELPLEEVERVEQRLFRIATTPTSSDRETRGDDALSLDVEAHTAALLSFYKGLRAVDSSDSDPATPAAANADDAPRGAASPSPREPVHSPAGQTDGSASNPTTPQEDRAAHTDPSGADNTLVVSRDPPVEHPSATATELTEATTAGTADATDDRNAPLTYGHATATLADLTKLHVESKQRLREEEARLQAERARTQQKKREYQALKAIVSQYRQRDHERKQLRHLLDSGGDSDGGDDANAPSVEEMRKLFRKETKRSRRLQENLSLKFQLLQSENERHKMKIEKLMAELRNEYTDSYVFGP